MASHQSCQSTNLHHSQTIVAVDIASKPLLSPPTETGGHHYRASHLGGHIYLEQAVLKDYASSRSSVEYATMVVTKVLT